MDQADTADPVSRPHPDIKTIWIIADVIFALVVGLVSLGVEVYFGGAGGVPGWIAAVIVALLVGSTLVTSGLQYAAHSYMIREHDVVACKGVIWRKRVCIPRSRLQHVDVGSGPLERRYGLCHMDLYTAGSPAAAATLPGLTPQRAEELRVELTGVRAQPTPPPTVEAAHG